MHAIVNVIFELIIEAFIIFEVFETNSKHNWNIFYKLFLLEFLVTAITSPLIVSYKVYQVEIFEIYSQDFVSNTLGEFNENWYYKYGLPVNLCMYVYYFINNLVLTAVFVCFPTWYVQRKDRNLSNIDEF